MIYKLLHRIFGWDYIQWRNIADSGIARIHVDHDGNIFYWRYKNTRIADPITEAKSFLWLTCPPSKYRLPMSSVSASTDREGQKDE